MNASVVYYNQLFTSVIPVPETTLWEKSVTLIPPLNPEVIGREIISCFKFNLTAAGRAMRLKYKGQAPDVVQYKNKKMYEWETKLQSEFELKTRKLLYRDLIMILIEADEIQNKIILLPFTQRSFTVWRADGDRYEIPYDSPAIDVGNEIFDIMDRIG